MGDGAGTQDGGGGPGTDATLDDGAAGGGSVGDGASDEADGAVDATLQSGGDAGPDDDASRTDDEGGGEVTDSGDGGPCVPAGPPCRGVCQPGGQCLETLASGQVLPQMIAVDGTNVYWTSDGPSDDAGTVMAMPKAGVMNGGMPVTIASGQQYPYGIAVDSTDLFWTDSNGQEVMRAPLDGGPSVAIATLQNAPWAIAVDPTGSTVYWTNVGTGVAKISADGGGAIKTFGSANYPYAIAVDQTRVYWNEYGPQFTTNSLFAATADDTATTLTTVANFSNPMAQSIAVDKSYAYWAEDFSVLRMALDGGSVTSLASGAMHELVNAVGIVVDSTNVYFTNTGTPGSLQSVPILGGPVTTLVANLPSPAGIAQDGASLYWVNQGTAANHFTDGSVMKLTPK